MTIMSAIVLFAVVWFMTLFVVLPLRLRTQAEQGEVVPGTPASAPDEAHIWRKVKLVTAVAVAIWAVLAAIIIFRLVSIADIDIFNTMDPGFHSR